MKAESPADVDISIPGCYPPREQHFSANWMFPPRLTYSLGLASAVQRDEFLTLTDGSVRGILQENINNPEGSKAEKQIISPEGARGRGASFVTLPHSGCHVIA